MKQHIISHLLLPRGALSLVLIVKNLKFGSFTANLREVKQLSSYKNDINYISGPSNLKKNLQRPVLFWKPQNGTLQLTASAGESPASEEGIWMENDMENPGFFHGKLMENSGKKPGEKKH